MGYIDYRYKFTDYNSNYEGMVIVANDSTPNKSVSISSYGISVGNTVVCKNESWVKDGSVIGISTGWFNEYEMEVRLFNPVWDDNGGVYYYYKVYRPYVSLISINEIRNKKRDVHICNKLKGNGLNCFPFVDRDYKQYCYSIDFKNIGGDSLKNTISFFGGEENESNKVRWYDSISENYQQFYSDYYDYTIHGKFNSDEDYLNYNPTPANKIFTDVKLISTKNTISGYFNKYWTNEVTELGLLCASDSFLNSNPESLDIINKELDVQKTPKTNGISFFGYHNFDNEINLLTNLSGDTLYWVRPYASTNSGVEYGSTVSGTTKSIGEKPEINFNIYTEYCTPENVFLTLEILKNGDSNISDYGVKIGLDDNNMSIVPLVNVSHNYYIGYLSNLSPNTEYKVYGFAENSDGITYDDSYMDNKYDSNRNLISVTDVSNEKKGLYKTSEPYKIPRISLLNINKNSDNMIVQASLDHDGGKDVSEYGVLYSKTKNNQNLSDYDNKITITGSPIYDVPGFAKNIFDITIPDTNITDKYYIVVYAKNSIGVSYTGNVIVNTSSAKLTSTITNIAENTVLVNSKIISIGDNIIINKGICWDTQSEPTINSSKNEILTNSGDQYTLSANNLSGSTTYYFRPYVTIKINQEYNEVIYGAEMKAITKTSTLNIEPILQVIDFSNIKKEGKSTLYFEVDSGIKIIDSGTKIFNTVGVGYLKDINNFNFNNLAEYENYYETNYFGDNNYKLVMNNLEKNSIYYIIAFARDTEDNLYFSQEKVLNTPDIVADDNSVIVTQKVKYYKEDSYFTVNVNINVTGFTYYGIEYSNGDLDEFGENIITGDTYKYNESNGFGISVDNLNPLKCNYFIKSFVVKNNVKTYSDEYNLYVYNQKISINTGTTININNDNNSIKFPEQPKKNDLYVYKEKTWRYNDEGWVKVLKLKDIDDFSPITNVNNNGSFYYNKTGEMVGVSASIIDNKFIVYFNEDIKFKTELLDDGTGRSSTESLYFFIRGREQNLEIEDVGWFVDLKNKSLYQEFIPGDFMEDYFNLAIENYLNGYKLTFKSETERPNEMVVFDSINATISSKNIIIENDDIYPNEKSAGRIRYRHDDDGSYCEMIMKISSDNIYDWVKIKENSFSQ